MTLEFKQGWEALANTRDARQPKYENCGKRMFADWHAYQCGNPAKHDPNDEGMPTRCGVHSAASIKKRQDRENAKAAIKNAEREKRRVARLLDKAEIKALLSISKGHNDPRTLATETLNKLGLL